MGLASLQSDLVKQGILEKMDNREGKDGQQRRKREM
jgi:hypothetical protein